jgi:hypothetical protein
MPILDWWVIALLGGLGGFANVALTRDSFAWPTVSSKAFTLGFLNRVFIGGVAALLTFWLGDLSKLGLMQQEGLSVAAGVSGATIIAGLSQQRRSAVVQQKKYFFRDAAAGLAELDNLPEEAEADPPGSRGA